MIREHDLVALTCDLPEEGLRAGDVGTVVHLHRGEAYEVEFVTWTGETVAVATVLKDQLRPVGESEMHHSRPMEKRA
jgi:hypothetical protein